jgi:hypothetical protein
MLTGNADLDTAIKVVNQSNIFRFLTKPCPPDYLAKAIEDGARQYELVISERELLENTLTGSIRVMTEILAIMDPKSFDRALALRGLMMTLGKALRVPALWELSAASLLSQIGATAIPQSVLVKQRSQQTLTAIEKDVVTRIPEIGHKLLVNIPRLENVARVVLYQTKHFDGSGFPEDTIAGDAIPLGSRMMFLLKDLAQIRVEGTSLSEAFNSLRSRTGFYDPKVVDAAFSCFINPIAFARPVEKELVHIMAKDLRIGHVLMDNIVTKDGILLISSGHVISGATLEKIRNFTIITGIKEPIAVENPTPSLQP